LLLEVYPILVGRCLGLLSDLRGKDWSKQRSDDRWQGNPHGHVDTRSRLGSYCLGCEAKRNRAALVETLYGRVDETAICLDATFEGISLADAEQSNVLHKSGGEGLLFKHRELKVGMHLPGDVMIEIYELGLHHMDGSFDPLMVVHFDKARHGWSFQGPTSARFVSCRQEQANCDDTACCRVLSLVVFGRAGNLGSMAHHIRIFGDPVLKTEAAVVTDIDGKVATLADEMLDVMYEAPGLGLAAPQIGIQKQIFVYDIGAGPMTIINPRIAESSGEWLYEEGCLSIPGLYVEMLRPKDVLMVGLDLDGNEVQVEATELEARLFQHELDHLHGVLMFERMTPEQRKEAMTLWRQMQEEPAPAKKERRRMLFRE
jgi:peptide deformylase